MEIERTETVRDLGLFISSNLSFSMHIDNIVSNATKKLFSITKKVVTNNKNILIKVFNTYIRPSLEYCSPLFNIQKLKFADQLETPQRKFTRILYRRIYGFTSNVPSYEERLKLFQMDSLATRRNVADIKIAHDFITKNSKEKYISLHYLNHGKTRIGGNYNYYGKIKRSLISHHFSSRMASKLNKNKINLFDHSTASLHLLLTNIKSNL